VREGREGNGRRREKRKGMQGLDGRRREGRKCSVPPPTFE